ncbi:unnamed protein product [Moneuplotes crassus]|uniref:BZIP domain-containing protein n=1 Tax=Euplotes crassus TaxID=5936 RepID=A0AAD1XFX0_EUPCR|nr:unnamed protein product [Moneuplotes crassus]
MEDSKSPHLKRKPPKTNKERSRQHRIRKKKFFEEIITENAELRRQVKQLQKENAKLKEQISIMQRESPDLKGSKTHLKSQFEHSLVEYEDYLYNHLSKKIIANSEEVRYTELAQVMGHICEWSDDRVDYIKTCFNKILDHMISQSSKCYYACNNILLTNTLDGKVNLKKRSKKYFLQ